MTDLFISYSRRNKIFIQTDMISPSLKALNWIYACKRDDFDKAMAHLAEALE